MRTHFRLAVGIFIQTIGLLAASCLIAAENRWQATTGSFLDANNWSAGIPSSSDTVIVNNGGVAVLAEGTSMVDAIRLGYLDETTFQGESGSIEVAGGTLTANSVFVGDFFTPGSLTVSDGALTVGDGGMSFGRDGSDGTFSITGGTATSTGKLTFGPSMGSQGVLTIKGGQLHAGTTTLGILGEGTWNQSGGLFAQLNGDLAIGDGGLAEQDDPGDRLGTLNLSGGIVIASDALAVGNRRGSGIANVSGGVIAVTGSSNIDDGNIYVGRGKDWEFLQGTGMFVAPSELNVVGNEAVIIANNSLLMNPNGVAESATLGVGITGPVHTTIRLGGSAELTNGSLKVELLNYTPKAGDSWTLIETGVDISNDKSTIDAIILDAGFDPVRQYPQTTNTGIVLGPFVNEDFSLATLPDGLSWNVVYENTRVLLTVTGQDHNLLGDYNHNGTVDAADYTVWKDNFGSTTSLDADGNANGTIDAADYTIWKDNFGAVGSSAASLVSDVPEPCMQILCVLSFAILIRRTRKSRDTMTVINPITIAIGCLFTCGQTAHAVELMFSVNSTLSNISAELFVDDFDVFATVQGFAGETQMTVPWRGDIVVSLDDALAPSNVSFVSSQLRADTYGPMLPDASGGNEGDVFLDNDAYPGTAEDANYGWILDGGDVFQAYWAIRDLAISITSPEMDIQSNSFDPTGMTLTLSSGETALNYGSIFGDIALVSSAAGVFSLNCSDPGSSVFTGCSHPAVAHYAVSQNLATISLPIGFGFVPNEVVGLSSTINSLNFHGTLVASATIDIEQALPGDYNQNGIVDAADYTIWKDNFGSSNNLSADGNGNGVIDAADYTVWKDNFGTTQAAVGPSWLVPEPNSLQLLARCLATAGLFLPIVRRRNRPAPSLICGIAAQYGLTDSVGSNV